MGTFGKKDTEIITGDGKHILRALYMYAIPEAGGATIKARVYGEDESDSAYNFPTSIAEVTSIAKSDDGTYFALNATGDILTIKTAACLPGTPVAVLSWNIVPDFGDDVNRSVNAYISGGNILVKLNDNDLGAVDMTGLTDSNGFGLLITFLTSS